MGEKYSHLNWNNRLQIERLLRLGYKPAEIARIIGCCRATIYNEIKRASYIHHSGDFWKEEERYSPEIAQVKYEENLRNKGSVMKLKEDPELKAYIEDKILNEKFSPAAVLMQIKNEGLVFSVTVKSVNTIYNSIKKGLFENLTMERCPYRKKQNKKAVVKRAKRAVHGKSIEIRPAEIDTREEFGHWEMDTVRGTAKNKKCLLVLTERKTRFEYIELMKNGTKGETVRALNRIEKTFGSSFFKIFKTITCDNGSEFFDTEGIEKALYRVGKRTQLYYCHPYCSSERGSNENQNKLIRRHYPKKTDFDSVLNKKDVKQIQDWINTYPRAMFNGSCSARLFIDEVQKLKTA